MELKKADIEKKLIDGGLEFPYIQILLLMLDKFGLNIYKTKKIFLVKNDKKEILISVNIELFKNIKKEKEVIKNA